MRIRWVVLPAAFVLACVPCGCNEPKIDLGPHSLEVDGLAVGVQVPTTTYARGERVKVTVVARNTTRRPILIDARSGAPVYVGLWRHTGLGWDQVKRYPEMATMVMNPWTLAARGERRFELILTVEPDWPTGERLRLTAELNGRPDVAPGVDIGILPPRPEE